VIAEEWLAKQDREGRAAATIKKNRWLLEFAYPIIGDRPIRDISAPEILIVLRKVESRGTYETARRLRSTCGIVFRYAVATARAETDPTFALQGALTTPKVTHRAAIIDPSGAGALLRAIDGFDGQPATRAALKLAPHVFVRPGELRTAEWHEFDLEQALWTIPAAKTKMRRVQKVPLSRQSLQILENIRELTGNGPLVFPGVGNRRRPLSENTLNAALRRLGYDKSEMTTHGFRAMAASLLNEMGTWNPDAIERQLGHVEANDVRRAYARAEFWDERIQMMQHWSDYLDELRVKPAK
jgi:integrase